MKFINVKSVLTLSFAATLIFSSCSKEEDMANVTPSNSSSTSTFTTSTQLTSIQDFAGYGTLTQVSGHSFDPNASNYGFETFYFSPNSNVTTEGNIFIYNRNYNLPSAGNAIPSSSPFHFSNSIFDRAVHVWGTSMYDPFFELRRYWWILY